MTDQVQVDGEQVVIRAGETTTLAWQVWIGPDLVAAPWQARCQVRASVDATAVLETWPCVIADGVVNVPLSATETAALTWSAGVIGVEVYDDTQAPEVVYRVVQAPIRVDPELVR